MVALPSGLSESLRRAARPGSLVRGIPARRGVCGVCGGAGAHSLSPAGQPKLRAGGDGRGGIGGRARRPAGAARGGAGGWVEVLGAGMIGSLVIQVLKAAGCRRVIALDLDGDRLELALRLGATAAARADSPGLAATIRRFSHERGVDAAFDVVGLATTVAAAVGLVRKGGSVTLVGNAEPRADLPLQAVVTRQVTLIGTCASAGEYPACLELIASGRVNVTEFISAAPPLEEGAEWFARVHAREKRLMKVLLKP